MADASGRGPGGTGWTGEVDWIAPEGDADRLTMTERRLCLALQAGRTGAFDVDIETGRGAWTAETATLWGLPPGFDGNLIEFWRSRLHPDELERVAAKLAGGAREGTETELEFRIVHPDGTGRWVRWRGQTTRESPGQGARLVGVNMDVTEHHMVTGAAVEQDRRASEGLRRSEARYRQIVDSASEGIWVLDTRSVTTFVNARMAAMLGFSPDQMIGRPLSDFLDQDELADHALRMEARRRGETEEYERRLRHRDGHPVSVLISAVPIYDDEGRYAGSFGMLVDIGERRRVEEQVRALNRELERQVQQYKSLLEQASDAIFVSDANRRYVDVNIAACSLLGYRREELLELSVADITPPIANPGQEQRFARMEAGEIVLSERLLRRKDGSVVPVELSSTRLPDGRIQAIVRDISARKILEEQQTRLAAAVEQADEAIVITDPKATIVYVNPSFERVSGYSKDELLGGNPRVLHSDVHDRAFYREMWSTLVSGGIWHGTFINRRKDGVLFEEDAVISPIHDADGRIVSYVGVKRDVTRERALEMQLRQAQKMEAVGQLAGGIAHDFNNLITAIRGFSELVRDGISPESPERGDIEQVILAAGRAADLTRQLLAFSRRQVLRPQVLEPGRVVDQLAPMLGRLLGEDIELTIRADPGRGRARVDQSQLEQVIVNLAVNARDAMPDGGRLVIQTASLERDEPFERSGTSLPAGRYVVLRVADSGIGMDEQVRRRAFEPFFTTKGPGGGSGMGLAMVYGIVKQSGAEILLDSAPGAGTTFEIYFPRVDDPAQAPGMRADEGSGLTGSEMILLVEDDEAVRSFARRALAALGYRVVEASNGREALEQVARLGEQIDLLVTDVVMPQMGGRELFERLREVRPGLPVLLMSGFPGSARGGPEMELPSERVLAKPFTREALALAVREALGPR